MGKYPTILATLMLICLSTSLCARADGDRWNIDDFGTTDPIKLGVLAFDSFSPATKARIRSYLAATNPGTAEGLLARGWLVAQDGDNASALATYRDCVKQFPEALACLSNTSEVTDDLDEKELLLKKLLKLKPSFSDFSPIRRMYFFLLNDRKDPAAAEAFLLKQEGARKNHAIFDYTRGLKALDSDRDFSKAALYFRKAVAKNELRRTEVYQRLIDLETGPLFEGAGDRLDTAANIVKEYYAKSRRPDRSLLLYLLKRFTEGQNTWGKRGIILRLAWATTGDAGAADWEPEFLDYVTPPTWAGSAGLANRVFREVGDAPQSSDQKIWLGRTSLLRSDDPEAALRIAHQGIEFAYTDKQRRVAINGVLDDLQLINRCDLADAEARRYLAAFKPGAGFYSQYFEVNLCTGDYPEALRSLKARRDGGESDNSVLRTDEVRLASAQAESEPATLTPVQAQPAAIPDTNMLALSPDGRRLALGTEPIRLVDTGSRQLVGYLGEGNRYRFTPDGKYFVALGKNGLTVREMQAGRVVGRVVRRDLQHFRDFSISPEGNQLAATDFRGFLYVFDLPTLKRVAARFINTNSYSSYVAWLKNGEIVTAAATETTVLRWHLGYGGLTQVGELDDVNWVHAMDVSPSGRYLLAGDNARQLHIWDTQTWEHRSDTVGLIGHIAFNPITEEAIVNQWNGNGIGAVVDLKLATWRSIPQPFLNEHWAYSPDGNTLYQAAGGLHERNRSNFAEKRSWSKPISDRAIASYPKLGVYAVRSGETTGFYRLDDGSLLRTVTAGLNLVPLAGAEGRFIGSRNGAHYEYDYAGDKLAPALPERAFIDYSAQFAASISVQSEIPGQLKIEFFKRGERGPFAEASLQAATEDLEYGDAPHNVGWYSEIDPSGRYWVVATSWQDGFGRGYIHSRWINVFELATGKLIKKLQVPYPVEHVHLTEGANPTLLVKTKDWAYPFDAQALEIGKARPLASEDKAVYEDDQIEVVQSDLAVMLRDKQTGLAKTVLAMPGSRLLGAAYSAEIAEVLTLDADGQVRRTRHSSSAAP